MKRFTSILAMIIVLSIIPAAVLANETVVKKEITVSFIDAKRDGLYTGEINDEGNPDGYGVFEAVNSRGYKYIIVGDWIDGHQTGEGWAVWENGKFEIGKFSDGVFLSGKYASGINLVDLNAQQTANDNTEEADNSELEDIIPYEELIRYGELNNTESTKDDNEKTPVKIEAIISTARESKDGYEIKIWTKGEAGYYYSSSWLSIKNKEVKLESGQRVIIEGVPSDRFGFINGNDIKSVTVRESGIDLGNIRPVEFETYSQYKSEKENARVILEAVVVVTEGV